MTRRQVRTSVGFHARARGLLLVTLTWLLAPFTVFATSTPQAPADLCIEGSSNCGKSPDSARPAKKWHPGFYMQVLRGSAETVQSTRFSYYDAIASNKHIVGVVVPFRWSQLEGDAQGDFTAGIALVRAEINKLKGLAVPKRLFIRINDHDYGNKSGTSNFYPAYITSDGYTFQSNDGVNWCRWDATAMGNYIAMWQAYAAAFDKEPYFEGLYLIRESTVNVTGAPCGFSASAYDTQLRRLEDAAAAAFPRSNVIQSMNYMPSGQSQVDSHIAYMKTVQVGTGAPDVVPPSCTSRNPAAYNTIQGISGGHDYRGDIPILYSAEVTEMGLQFGSCTPAQIRDFANDTLRVSHLFYDRNTFAGTSDLQWTSGILPYIENVANALTHTSCPAIYTQGCDTN